MKRGDILRKAVAGLLVVCILLCLPGCSADKVQQLYHIQEFEPVEKETIILEVFAWEDEEKNVRALMDCYAEINPEVSIHLNILPSSEYSQQMMAIKQGMKECDCVFFPNVAEAAVWVDKGVLQTLEPWIQKETALIDEKKYNGFMLPYRMSRWAVFYNKAIFDDCGIPYPDSDWTWDEYAQLAVRLTNRVGVNKRYGSLGFEPTSIWWRVPARTRGAENPLQEEELQKFRESVEWVYNLTYELEAQQPYTEQTGSQGKLLNEIFLSGEAAMFFCGDWTVSQLNDLIRENKLDFSYDIAPMPRWEEEARYAIADAAVIAMTESTKYPNETFEWIQFVSGPDGAAVLAERGIIPAWESDEIRGKFLNSSVYPEHMEYFFMNDEESTIPASKEYSEAMEIMRDEVASYLLQEQDIEQCFENIEQTFQENGLKK